MESELVGLMYDEDFRWLIFAPEYLTVVADDEVEFERDNLRFTAGGRIDALIFDDR